MAEAHAAVAFQFTVTQDGLRLHVSQEAFEAVYLSGIRSWRKRITRFRNRFHSGVYPARFSSLGIVILASIIIVGFGYDVPFVQADKISNFLSLCEDGMISRQISTFIGVFIFWIISALILRYTLKFLLGYHGWMYEAHRKTSLITKIWGMITKLLCKIGGEPQLYSYQASLPRLPVPSVKETVDRYLSSVRPLHNDSEYDRIKILADEFKSTVGSKLQRYLLLKSWWGTNYVSDWWEQYVYLAGRDPIMVNSNYYGMDLLYLQPTHLQPSRAAALTHALFSFRSNLDKELIKPIRIAGIVPLCSWQYERIFNTTRIPGVEIDQNIHLTDSRHIAVYHNGRWFKVTCYKNGLLCSPRELEEVFETILKDDSEPCEGEANLGALTASNRRTWAETRIRYFSTGSNRSSLGVIEGAAFVVVLDDEEHFLSDDDIDSLSNYGRSLLHGKCSNRWFDKSVTIVVYKNGRFGINAEHSWADAPIVSHVAEEILYAEAFELGYNESGKCKGLYTKKPIPPKRLKWSMTEDCIETIDYCLAEAEKTLK